MNNLLCLSLILFIMLSIQNAKSSSACDSYQTEQTLKDHSAEILKHSMEQIFNHFYQNTKAYTKSPYEFLIHGELKGYKTRNNPKSKGKNSFVNNLRLAQKSQYYLKCSGNNKDLLCQTPPSYLWGGMGWYDRNEKGEFFLNLHGNDELTTKLSGHPGLDCSGLAYAIFSNAKLRVTSDLTRNPSFETADNTPARSYKETEAPTSCFKNITQDFASIYDLLPGDVIVWKKHMLLVDSVGSDPFGINHIQEITKCDIKNIKPENASMIVVNSKGSMERRHSYEISKKYISNTYFKNSQNLILKNPNLITGVGMGISKQYLKEFYYTSPEQIFNLAIHLCQLKFNKNATYTGDAMIIRHKAFFPKEERVCGCFAREQDLLVLKPEL